MRKHTPAAAAIALVTMAIWAVATATAGAQITTTGTGSLGSAPVMNTAAQATARPEDQGAFGTGGLVFFAVLAILVIGGAVLYLRNRSVARGES